MRLAVPLPPRTFASPRFLAVLVLRGRPALGDCVHEPVNVLACHGRDLHAAEKRLYVPLDAALVRRDRADLFRSLAPRQKSSRLGVRNVEVAQIGDARGLAFRVLFCGRVGAIDDVAKDALCRLARRLGRPG